MVQIIPAIQVKTFEELQKKLDLVRDLVKRVQIDIVDEKFEANAGVKVEDLSRAKTSLILEVQLMVQEPIGYLNWCDVVGVERVYGHVEQMSDQEEFVETATDLGMQVGLGLDIHTPIVAVEKVLPYVDGILLMSVEVGFSGQEFDQGVLEKITDLRDRDFGGDICIDGGLDAEEIRLCRERGANQFAVGSALWKPFGKLRPRAKDLKRKLEELRKLTTDY